MNSSGRPSGACRYRVITGLPASLLRILIVLNLFFITLRHRLPLELSLRAVRELRRRRQAYSGGNRIRKLIGFERKFYFGLNTPGWPSGPFSALVHKELSRLTPNEPSDPYLRTVIFGITTKCALNCRHCYAGAVLNEPEALSLQDLRAILAKFQRLGLAQMQWSGGEPLCRFQDMLALTREAKPGTEFWVLSSGTGLTADRAREMKEAGITGVNISLDHWLPEQHNSFRGSESSYAWVERAIRNARSRGLLVAVTLCATPQFVSAENLRSYAALAERLGAAFLQILEARAIGHLAGADLELEREKLDILDDFFRAAAGGRRHSRVPIVIYPGYHQRRFGCSGAGDEFLYVDPLGTIRPCPFSETQLGNALTDDLERILADAGRRCRCDRYVLANQRTREKPLLSSSGSAMRR